MTALPRTFSELEIGDTFSFSSLAGEGGREAWEKIREHTARRVNSFETRNVSGNEYVSLLMSEADRRRAIREDEER